MISKKILLLFDACQIRNIAYIKDNLDFETVNHCDQDNRTMLHVACINNHNDVIETILKFLPNVNIEDNNGLLPVSYLIKNNNNDMIKNIFENYNGVFSYNQLIKNLSIACIYDNVEIFEYFHKKLNFDINLSDLNNNTFLMISAKYNSLKIFKYLIDNNIDIHAKNNEGNNAFLFSINSNCISIFEYLIDKVDINYRNNKATTGLMLAIINKHYKIAEILIKNNCNLELKDYDGNTALHYAVLNNDHKLILLLIKKDNSILNLKDFDGNTPFMIAAKFNYEEAFEIMMNYDIDINLLNNENINAFQYTWLNGNMRLAKLILQKYNSKLNLNELINNQHVNEINIEEVNSLIFENIEKIKEDVDISLHLIKENEDNNKDIDIDVNSNLNNKFENNLVDNNLDNEYEDIKIKSDLCYVDDDSIFKENQSSNILEIKSDLIDIENNYDNKTDSDKKQEPNIKNEENIEYININDNLSTRKKFINEIIKLNIIKDLNNIDNYDLERKKDMNNQNNKDLFTWVLNKEEHLEIMNGKKEEIFMNEQSKTSPTIYFAKIGKTNELFKLLKENPLRIYEKTSTNKNALMYASQFNNINCAKLLLLVGIDVNKVDDHKSSALMYATYMGNYEIVKLLLSNGANTSLKDADGLTAMDIALKNNDEKMVNILSGKNEELTNEFVSAKTSKIDLNNIDYL